MVLKGTVLHPTLELVAITSTISRSVQLLVSDLIHLISSLQVILETLRPLCLSATSPRREQGVSPCGKDPNGSND